MVIIGLSRAVSPQRLGSTCAGGWPSRLTTRLTSFFLGAAAVCGAAVASAEAPHSQHPTDSENVVYLTLEEALSRGASAGPEVGVADAPREALAEAAARANPVFTQVPTLQAQFGPRFSRGDIHPDVTVSVSQPVPLTRVGPVQQRLARAEKMAVEREFELAQLDSAERAGRAWVDLALSERSLLLRQESQKRALENLRIVESRVRHGEADPSVFSLAASELADAKSRVLEAEGDHYLAASDLAYFAGLSEDTRAEVKTTLLDEPPISSSTEPGGAVEAHPAVQSAAAAALASKEAIAYAKAQQAPNASFGVQYQREGTGDQIITGIFTLPLPAWKPWRFQEARARANYDAKNAQVALAQRNLERWLERMRHEYSHAKAQYQIVKDQLVPPRKEAVRLARLAFAAGEHEYLRVVWAERELLAAEERLVTALADVHRARLQLLRFTGRLGKGPQ